MNVSLTAFFALKNRHSNDVIDVEEMADEVDNDNADGTTIINGGTASDMMDYLIQQPSANFYLGVYLTVVGKCFCSGAQYFDTLICLYPVFWLVSTCWHKTLVSLFSLA